MELIDTIATYSGYLCGIAAGVAIVAKAIMIVIRIQEGIKCQLRHDMLHIYYKNLESKTIRQYELENFLLMYKAYKSLRGNSFIDEIYEDVTSWKIIS